MLELSRAAHAERPFEFVFAPQAYRLHSAGGGLTEATFAWDQALLADLAAIQQVGRDPVVLQRLGDRLREFLASTKWPVLEAQMCDAVKQQRPVVVTFRSAAAELYALPWELLTVEATGQHIGELPGVLVRYEWPDTETVPPAGPQAAGRLLLAWSGHVPAAEHQAAVQDACAAGRWSFDPEHDALADASCGRLSERLAEATRQGRPIQVLHLLCHGTVTGSAFGFALDDDEAPGRVAAVDAGRLRQILAPHAGTLRLVVLAACDGGNCGALGNHLGSVAQGLHRAGIAGVVASRFPLSTSGSKRLARALYLALCKDAATLEQAFLAARRHLAEDAQQLDWASLQLYARSADGSETRLAAALDSLRGPEVEEQLSQFRALFREARNQIGLLGRYKAFHDILQELEVPFNAVERDRKRLLASAEASAEAWNELRDPLEELQQRIGQTLEVLAADRLRDEFALSRRRLTEATAALTAALAGERARLDAAMQHVRRVIGLDLSSANNRLIATARELGLGAVVAALRAVLGNLGRGGAEAAIHELTRLVTSLADLHGALEALVHEHDQWQEIDNNLRLLVGSGAAAADELAVSWPLLRASIAEVVKAGGAADWTRAVDAAAQALDGELARGADAGKSIASLRSLWRRCNQRFVDVDKQLLRTCEQLRQVGDTLDSVLEVIDDG
ncbi:MAG TPA: CHAT domain-containing protein [Kofleriaceae bacterium]|nr:CHAT domain-containing protein [Kofleriaceae bacterium]